MAILGENMDFDNPNSFKFNHRSGDVYLPKIQFEEPLKTEIEHYLDCIQNDVECLTGASHAKKVVEILAAIVGGKEKLRDRPLLTFLTCPVSPLKLVRDCCEIIMEAARDDLAVNILSMAMAGGSSPATGCVSVLGPVPSSTQ